MLGRLQTYSHSNSMADPGESLDKATIANDAPTAVGDFLEQSYLTYVVPSRTNINLDDAFKDAGAGKPILESIEQRESLFFGNESSLRPCQVRSPTS